MSLTIETTDNVHDAQTPAVKKQFSADEAKQIGEALSIYWQKFDVDQFLMGLNVELEHGRREPATDVTHDDPIVTGKIALAHLNEFPDYYTRLAALENEEELGIKRKSKRERGKNMRNKNYTYAPSGVYNSNEVITWKKKK